MPIAKVHVMINTLTFFPLPAPTGIALQASRKVPVEVHLVSLLGQEQALQRKHRLMRLLLPPRPASAPCTLILNAIWASWPAILEHGLPWLEVAGHISRLRRPWMEHPWLTGRWITWNLLYSYASWLTLFFNLIKLNFFSFRRHCKKAELLTRLEHICCT